MDKVFHTRVHMMENVFPLAIKLNRLVSKLDEVAVYKDAETGEYFTDNFTPWEFRCKCSKCKGEVAHPLSPQTVARAEAIRIFRGKATVLNSAYRCPDHPEEVKKLEQGKKVGRHCNPADALDFRMDSGQDAYDCSLFAMSYLGCNGVAVGKGRSGYFLHTDSRPIELRTTWTY